MNSAALSGLIKLANAIDEHYALQSMGVNESCVIPIDLTIEEVCKCLNKVIPVGDKTFKMIAIAGVNQSKCELEVVICHYEATFNFRFEKYQV